MGKGSLHTGARRPDTAPAWRGGNTDAAIRPALLALAQARAYPPAQSAPLSGCTPMYRVSPFVRHFARALLGGAGIATLWVNLDPASYYDLVEFRLLDLQKPAWIAGNALVVTPLTVVSDLLMAFFVFFVGKELWEALILDRGALAGRRALIPAGAVLGGLIGAVALWLLHAHLFVQHEWVSPSAGWPLPLGSEIVLGFVAGRMVFGPGHPALHLLLLLAIASNVAGLLLHGLTHPAGGGLHLFWLLLPLAASLGVWHLFGRPPAPGSTERERRRGLALWPYMVAGALSWAGTAAAGLPGALGLLPIIPAIPHADRAFGLFAEAEEFLNDPLNRLAHLLVKPVAAILFFFGLTQGGIDLAAFAPTTLTVLAALWIGKPLGLFLGALSVAWLLRLPLPAGIRIRDLFLIAAISGMGFTAPLLTLDTALPGGAMAEAARLGLALSLLAWPAALLLARLMQR
jgi:NhaA family Na+:H+ antiporter